MSSSENYNSVENTGAMYDYEEMEIQFKRDKVRVKSNFTRSRNKLSNLLDQDDLPSRREVRNARLNMDTCQEIAIGVLTNFFRFLHQKSRSSKE